MGQFDIDRSKCQIAIVHALEPRLQRAIPPSLDGGQAIPWVSR
jgi:hypothetical protein